MARSQFDNHAERTLYDRLSDLDGSIAHVRIYMSFAACLKNLTHHDCLAVQDLGVHNSHESDRRSLLSAHNGRFILL